MGQLKTKSVSPQQTWARRRNWEKRTLRGLTEELEFRLYARWKGCSDERGNIRTQTATDLEIQQLTKAVKLLSSILEQWSYNYRPMKQNINFKKFK